MNKNELVAAIAKNSGLTKAQAGEALEGLIVAVKDELISTGKLRIADLGTFDVVNCAAKTGRNPRTGEPITIPAYKRVKFKSAKLLKEAIN